MHRQGFCISLGIHKFRPIKSPHFESMSDFLLFFPNKRCSFLKGKKGLHFGSVSDFIIFTSED